MFESKLESISNNRFDSSNIRANMTSRQVYSKLYRISLQSLVEISPFIYKPDTVFLRSCSDCDSYFSDKSEDSVVARSTLVSAVMLIFTKTLKIRPSVIFQ